MLTKHEEIRLPVFFISCFTVSELPSINTFESSYDFMILIIWFISSFEINKVNPFPAQTVPFPFIFPSNLFIAFESKLLTNPGKLSLAKETKMNSYICYYVLPKLPNISRRSPPDWIILDNCSLLSFIFVGTFLAMAFLF